jgi:hypothetical protein
MDNKKRHRALTDTDRLIIQKRNQEHPPGHQKELVDWFTATTSHPLNQSQVSKILSSIYDYLDSAYTRRDKQMFKEKNRSSIRDWPDLEYALYEWQQHIEQKKAIITGDILKTKAKQLWDALPQYNNIMEPK